MDFNLFEVLVMEIFSIFRKEVVRTIQVTPNFQATNLWHCEDFKTLWLYKFLDHHKLLEKGVTVNLISVFGKRPTDLNKDYLNIFFTAENVHYFKKYNDNGMSFSDLSLGFDYIDHPKYHRFPLWITYLFPPDSTFDKVKEIVNNYNYSSGVFDRPTQFSLIASHNYRGKMRKKIVNFIEANFGRVECAGKFMNNTNKLKVDYKDNKLDYLKQVVFNICPENTNNKGYTTEKIFEAIQCGCIPIYWGDESNPEPTILNREAILFYKDNTTNEELKKNLNQILSSKNIDTIPRFTDNAAEEIWRMIYELRNKIDQLIVEKKLAV